MPFHICWQGDAQGKKEKQKNICTKMMATLHGHYILWNASIWSILLLKVWMQKVIGNELKFGVSKNMTERQ